MVRVMDAAGITEDLAAYPLMHFIGGNEPGVWLPVVGGDEVNWRVRPALVIVSHGLLRYLFTGSAFTFWLIPYLTMKSPTFW
ncbi:Uncharacterised protein [Enterobacter cloacae]|nr:Uncharacterised protein [Enterobacter cloacae]